MLTTISLYPNHSELKKYVLRSPNRQDKAGPCLSIYLPRQSPSFNPSQRKFRFIKLVKQVEQLVARDHGIHYARDLVRKLWLTDPLGLIESSGLSLAWFHDQEFTGAMHLPLDVPERAIAASSFHVKPVLSWLQSSPHFYLISLTSRRVRLFEGNSWELKLIRSVRSDDDRETEDNSISESEWGFDTKAIRSESKSGPTKDTGRNQRSKEKVRQLFLKAEKEFYPIVSKNRSPVVMAGVSWLHPIYRRVNRDPDLIHHAVQGNVEKWSEDQLRQAVFGVLEKVLQQARREISREFRELAHAGGASDDLTEIARAAVKGKVRKILLASDQTLFGKIDRRTGGVTLHSEQLDSADDDVLDDLAEAVLSSGGKVLCVPSRDLPTSSPVAAVLNL